MDQYEELELIGKGTYGKVFKVRSRAEDEIYVIKKVQFDGTPQSEAEAALREGQMLSLLRHPHVVPYKEFFKHPDGDLCLVMAYCEGGDLFHYIRDLRKHGRTVPEPQVWQWLVQLLLSLSYIHAKRILHRDVKTQNIFLSEGKVLLGDFGLAKQLQRTFEMARTPIGTPYYMAPEIYEEQPYSFKSDVWALGCVMYEMMTGKAAFAADNLSRVVLRVIRGQYDPLPESYSAPLRSVVTSMLCRDVKTRPDANQLLTVAPVVPHVQSYLETLTAEGPNGWATWRMKLPLTAMVQMSEALEAAGVTPGGGGGGGGRLSRPSSAHSLHGAGAAMVSEAALLPTEPPLAPEPPAPAPATPDPGRPTTGGGGGGGGGGKVVKLPPLPGAKVSPQRTPYGLATPFMGGALQPQQHYAELHMLTHQVMAIRTSQCGDGAAPSPLAGRGVAGSPVAAATAVVSVPAAALPEAPPASEEVVKALDRTLIKTLEIARKAAADNTPSGAATAAGGGEKGGGAAAGGVIDEAWLSAGLPQGGFGFGHTNSHKEPAGSDVSLPPIQPRRSSSANRPQSSWGAAAANAGAGAPPCSPQQPATPPPAAPTSSLSSPSPDPWTPSPEVPLRASHYEVPDDGFVTLSNVTLHAQSLCNRRTNLEQYCAERLGEALMGQVMQAVVVAQRRSREGGDMAVAEAALRRQLDRLLGAEADEEEGRLRQELGPLIEEMALLHC
ncbi:Serine/threonine-protein kinase Nek11 [Pleodorina starrii]|nr:Serine/threonine-protein kinase Nek11 [Pleodorina starrii]GLC67944.1 Serine/threonine-protein kinase Nek11 [Pleodorina starrii]